MKSNTTFAFTTQGPVRVEKRALDQKEFLQRRKERKRAQLEIADARARKFAAANALFKI